MDETLERLVEQAAQSGEPVGSRLFAVPGDVKHLDSADLGRLEAEFRRWAEDSPRADVRLSRRRILLAFLLLRHTGARLGEVLGLDPARDLDLRGGLVRLGGRGGGARREVRVSEQMARELADFLADPDLAGLGPDLLRLEPGHLRRKFYERTEALGLARDLGGPTVIRRSRAIELLQGGAPLPLVQRMLGHSTPSLAGGYLDLRPEEVGRAEQHYVDRESRRTTSARNSFFGRITSITRGDIQCLVELTSVGGHRVAVMITNESRGRMGLSEGGLATVEVKAPWVQIAGVQGVPASACNRYLGRVERVTKGKLTSEVVVRLEDNTRLCAIITEAERAALDLFPGDPAWAFFTAFAAVLHVD